MAVKDRGNAVLRGKVKDLAEKLMPEGVHRIRVEGKGNLGALAVGLKGLKGFMDGKMEGGVIGVNAAGDAGVPVGRLVSTCGVGVSAYSEREVMSFG